MIHLSPNRAFLAALLLLSMPVTGGCSSSPTNPLLGSWKFSSTTQQSGPSACSISFVFADKTATITTAATSVIPGGTRSMAVTYVAAPTMVAVMTNAAGHVNYTFTDKDHMYTEDPWGKCFYQRS
jgi:hypothetical protein